MHGHDPLLRAEHIHKSFGVTKALCDVSLEVHRGEILGLMGENGSGKSTLASIIARVQPQDSGELFFDGSPYLPRSAVEASERGVCMVLQERGTFGHLSVARNILIGKERRFSRWGLLDNRAMEREARRALEGAGVDSIPVDLPAGKLGFEDRKLVELARALYSEPRLLIIDETTTALSKRGREVLYAVIERMRGEGRAVLFISHDIDEMMTACDSIAVLRDGVYVDSLSRDRFSPDAIKRLMVGREIAGSFYRADFEPARGGEAAMVVEGLEAGALRGVSFTLARGEILGIAGLTDCGMHDLGKAAFGSLRPRAGSVRSGRGALVSSPAQALREGIAYISKDRDQEALMTAASIRDNICLPSYFKLGKGCFVSPAKERSFTAEWSGALSVKMRDGGQYVMDLSGGNKQKVALAKWLGFGADVFILDCPTRGIDVGVKATIYQLMARLREQGKSILLVSEELTEVIGMSDRILALKEGRVSGELARDRRPTENDLIELII